jgi:hypothetical protein
MFCLLHGYLSEMYAMQAADLSGFDLSKGKFKVQRAPRWCVPAPLNGADA